MNRIAKPIASKAVAWFSLAISVILTAGLVSGVFATDAYANEATLSDSTVTYSHSDSATLGSITLTVEWNDPVLGQETTFHVSASGGSGNYKYYMSAPMYSSTGVSGTYGSVADPSRTKYWHYTEDVCESYDYSFVMTATGTYYYEFSVMDMGNQPYKTLKTRTYVQVADANYPSVASIVGSAVSKAKAASDGSEYEMALWLHDWLLDQLEYDNSLKWSSAESALTRHTGTCQAYTNAYIELLNAAGITNAETRDTYDGHTWNAVKLDGEWYQVDCTWDDNDDTKYYGFDARHLYFAITDELMAIAHKGHAKIYTADGYATRSTSLKDNYYVKSGLASQWADAYAERIQAKLDAKETSFSITSDNAYNPPSIIGIQNATVAYAMNQKEWAAADGSIASLVATSNVTTVSNTKWTAVYDFEVTYSNPRTSLANASVTVSDQTYTGEALTPAVAVVLDGKTLEQGTDYEVTYSNNVSAGVATVTVTGKGNYISIATGAFTIAAANASGATVNLSDQTYTGSALTPAPEVALNGKTLKLGTDYEVAYSNNTNVGQATMVISFKGNYSGSTKGTFSIKAVDASKAEVKVAAQTWTGKALTPAPAVLFNGKTLVQGVDYTVVYSDNVNIGTASITVAFKGNYTGSAKGSFRIAATSISAAVVTASTQTYTSSAITPAVTVTLNGKTLARDADYTVAYSNNVNAGTATITVTGKCNYAGTAIGTFTIKPATISSASVVVDGQTFTGSVLTPAVTVKLGSKTLVRGTDYEVAYSNNVNVGTATVVVTGKGNYVGTKTSTFTIAAANLSAASVWAAEQTYTGNSLTSAPSVTLNGKALKQGSDYTVDYSNNINAGTATITVMGKGNYIGTAVGTFTIKPSDASSALVSVSYQTYTDSALTPTPTVTLNGKTFTKDTGYTVAYSNNTYIGTATATVTFKGNYTGTATGTFAIVAPFKDVDSGVAHNGDIAWLAARGVSEGWTEADGTKTFRPYTNVARADMAAFLYRLAGSPKYTAPVISPFKDCNASTSHYKEICWLASKGISTGWSVSGGKEFRPYTTVARCDMAAFLYRMASSPGYTAPSGSPFKDCSSKTPHYKEVCWLADKGVSAGWSVANGKEFRPYSKVARADMAAFLRRMKDKGLT